MNINHRSLSTLAVATAMTAGAASVLALVPTAPTGAQTAAGTTGTTIVIDQRDGNDHFVDVAPLGGEERPPSIGDEYVATNFLLDHDTHEQIGRTHSVCVTTRLVRHPLNAFANCTVVMRTGSDQLILEASWSFNAAEQALAVTGGTGAYAGARGTATWKSLAGERSRWTITLAP